MVQTAKQSANSRHWKPWAALVTLNVLAWCATIFITPGFAGPRDNPQPFPNAEQQRQTMIQLLQKQNELLTEQNALLKSGKLRVSIGN